MRQRPLQGNTRLRPRALHILGGACLLATAIALAQGLEVQPAPGTPGSSTSGIVVPLPPGRQADTVRLYCAGCHNNTLHKGDFSFSAIDVTRIAAHTPLARKMIKRLSAMGDKRMPPEGEPEPDSALRAALVAGLEWQLSQPVPPEAPAAEATTQHKPELDLGPLVASAAAGGRLSAHEQAELVSVYCARCHNDKFKVAGFSLSGVDVSHMGARAEMGENMVRKLRSGLMPPMGSPRPAPALYNALADGLEQQLDMAAATQTAVTPPGLHRVNRAEYANAVRDLLALDIDPAALLPVDDASFGFDNMAGTLGVSPALLEGYLSAAGKISRLALGHELGTTEKTYLTPSDYSQIRHVEGLPFGTRGGLVIDHDFPADGEYIIGWMPVRASTGILYGSNAKGEQLELSIDGARVRLFDIDKEVGFETDKDVLQARLRIKAGAHRVGLAFVASAADLPSEDLNQHLGRTLLDTGGVSGFTYFPHVNTVSIMGPFNGARPADTLSRRRIFTCRPTRPAQEESCARTIVAHLATRAFRRPVTATDTAELLRFYHEGRKRGDFETGIEEALQRILADPEFVFRAEREPAAQAVVARPHRISDFELASRLSFFLWSSPPDEELLGMARHGSLHQPGALNHQVERMLADHRSHALVTNFAGQWLQLRNLASTDPNPSYFPAFDDNLRQAFKTETEMFFESIVRENRSVITLLDADYTFLNERLAKHYGIPHVYGSQFRRVTLGPEFDARRGLLGQGSILTVTSVADRTSPVLRGKWVLLNILGVVAPEPPPNIPPLKESATQANGQAGPVRASMRTRMSEHRANPACASCHKMLDPVGFAMESFDGIGAWRSNEHGIPLDLSGQLVDGTRFNGPAELRQALLRYSPQFVQTFTERLLTYALGRGLDYRDMPTVRAIVRGAQANQYRFGDLVAGIVASQPFRMNEPSRDQLVAHQER